jgi:hypothetical protein
MLFWTVALHFGRVTPKGVDSGYLLRKNGAGSAPAVRDADTM